MRRGVIPDSLVDMRRATEVAEEALEATVEMWVETGLARQFGSLVQDVWATNLARHEPDELGDNAKTLGYVCAVNLAERIERRIRGHEFESKLWDISGLGVSKPNGALCLTLESRRFYVKKAPMVCGRSAQWESLVSWEGESHTRQSIAELNSRALGGYQAPADGQQEFWPFLTADEPGVIRDYMVVWAGDSSAPLTAGWLTIPALGAVPFAAVLPLWWDEAPDAPLSTRRLDPKGPSFDERPSITPSVTLRPRPGSTGRA